MTQQLLTKTQAYLNYNTSTCIAIAHHKVWPGHCE